MRIRGRKAVGALKVIEQKAELAGMQAARLAFAQRREWAAGQPIAPAKDVCAVIASATTDRRVATTSARVRVHPNTSSWLLRLAGGPFRRLSKSERAAAMPANSAFSVRSLSTRRLPCDRVFASAPQPPLF